jgi:hypothetical protein
MERTTTISQKHFKDEAKRYKRRHVLTADQARDAVARKYNFENYDKMVEFKRERGDWK